jgi:DNA invertase Pin-like site-specific DNA recombinase
MPTVIIGYARVSTDDQNLDLQRNALTRAGCTRICKDRISGAKAARPARQPSHGLWWRIGCCTRN